MGYSRLACIIRQKTLSRRDALWRASQQKSAACAALDLGWLMAEMTCAVLRRKGSDAAHEPGDFAGSIVGMDNAVLRSAHQFRLGMLECLHRLGLLASGNRLLHLADGGAHPAAARLVDLRAADGLPCCLLG